MTDVLWTAPVATGPVDALVSVPGSKSLTARWLVLAALAEGPSTLRHPLVSRDARLMQDGLEQLGARFSGDGSALEVHPLPRPDPTDRSAEPLEISTGLAGTVMRFLPLVAALHVGPVRFTGDAAALVRPMGPVISALRALGVEVTEHGQAGHLPITVHGAGHLPGGTVEVDASASSQFISNLLLVAPCADAPLVVRSAGTAVPSLPHIEMTVATLREAGVEVQMRTGDDGRPEWEVHPGPIRAGERVIEPDLSNAGPFLAAALVAGGEVGIADWPETTTQAGDAYRELLTRMGGTVWREGPDVCVRGDGTVHGLDADLSAVGELVPTIAALAALADSPSHLRGIGHLRGHETDRVHALAVELDRLGARTVEHEDSLEIMPAPLHGAVVETYEDHRMATAAAIIGLRVPDVRVVNVETTQKTLPDFVGMWLSMLHTDRPAGGSW
ncbi:3-phosphoshikimate 1-carboxyvinyltransferase [Brachybacterium sp. EF45031]|uniref:3-phosphoshikimate 1-carboxyvinyltransferase n=1 Tax=Brachybacterium sillae TaxID=2810536 RepID=UPI00217DA796|nr:3-phosphoshikimate 1-carboxyvinyltransferase [Brachybacterium sillae]MCS6710942.1 3-phosphoshikimate 1-carboxyvinyltransferase [Brachybacterium sillae]